MTTAAVSPVSAGPNAARRDGSSDEQQNYQSLAAHKMEASDRFLSSSKNVTPQIEQYMHQKEPIEDEEERDDDAEQTAAGKTDVELAYLRWQSSMKLRAAWERIFARVQAQRKGEGASGEHASEDDVDFARDIQRVLDGGDDAKGQQPSAEFLLALMSDWQPRKRIVPPIVSDLEKSEGYLDDDRRARENQDPDSRVDEAVESDDDVIDFSRPNWEDDVRGKKRPRVMERIEDAFTSLAHAMPFDSDDSDAWTDSDDGEGNNAHGNRTPLAHPPKSPAIAQLMSLFPQERREVAPTSDDTTAPKNADSPQQVTLLLREQQSTLSPTHRLATPCFHMSKDALQGSQLKPMPRVASSESVKKRQRSPHVKTAAEVAPLSESRKSQNSATEAAPVETPLPKKRNKMQHEPDAFSSPSMSCGGAGRCTKSFCMVCGAIGRIRGSTDG